MFFADPVAAFTNIARAVRPGARLAMLVWQEEDRNEWATAIRQVLAAGDEAAAPPGLDPFSLADPDVVRSILGICSREWTRHQHSAYSAACARCSLHMKPAEACCSTRAPGWSRLAAVTRWQLKRPPPRDRSTVRPFRCRPPSVLLPARETSACPIPCLPVSQPLWATSMKFTAK